MAIGQPNSAKEVVCDEWWREISVVRPVLGHEQDHQKRELGLARLSLVVWSFSNYQSELTIQDSTKGVWTSKVIVGNEHYNIFLI